MYDTRRITYGLSLRPGFHTVAGDTEPIRAQLEYDAADPYAVRLSFVPLPAGERAVVFYRFDRELLVDGLGQRAKADHVEIRPHATSPAWIALTLTSHEAYPFTVFAEREVVADFVDVMLMSVPLGRETAEMDIDSELSEILGGGES